MSEKSNLSLKGCSNNVSTRRANVMRLQQKIEQTQLEIRLRSLAFDLGRLF